MLPAGNEGEQKKYITMQGHWSLPVWCHQQTFSITLIALVLFTSSLFAEREQPNVLLIAIDDLNDWTGCLGGHPQAKTPYIDKLASRGTLFANAHCQAPVCQPSRASLMTSMRPSSTGLYFLNPGIDASPPAREKITLPARFAREGYYVMGAGKLFHTTSDSVFSQLGEYGGGFGYFGPQPTKKISQPHGHPLWDWGAYPERTEQMPDSKIAAWAAARLQQTYKTPFFLAVGFYRPHVPMLVPQHWFNEHPEEKVQLPLIQKQDVDDLSEYARDLTTREHVAPLHEWIVRNQKWEHAVQSYLASCTFVDACVGKVLQALDNSPYRDNTLVILFSDHGFHLGEKERWAKRSLWEDGTRVPLILSGAGLPAGQVCQQPAGLIDIYPTLLDLCSMAPDKAHEGISLKPQIDNPQYPRRQPAITTFGPGNHSIRSTNWRYIRYRDGSEELYDHRVDPHEWKNLANHGQWENVLADHRQYLPKQEHPVLGANSTGHRAFMAAENRLAERRRANTVEPATP